MEAHNKGEEGGGVVICSETKTLHCVFYKNSISILWRVLERSTPIKVCEMNGVGNNDC
jgi:hypothetical protein